jgi:predicted secreted protein
VPERILTEAQNDGRLTVHVGDDVTVRLSESSGAGYRWTVESLDGSCLVMMSQSYEPASPGVGSAGTAVWRFTAKSAGFTRLAMRKRRPWEPGDSAAQRFTVTVDVVE